jgi:multiple sugar transport system ATP-binding protein
VATLYLHQVTKRFRSTAGTEVTAVDALSLEVADGEWVALTGPSGCGKTTVLRLVAGLERPDSGLVRIGSRIVTDVPARDRDVGMVFQAHALYPQLTAAENIGFGLRVRGVSRAETQARVREYAQMLGVTDCLPCLPGELSGGQGQRVAIARALVRRPSVLLMDEPLSDLDGPLRRQLLDHLVRLRKQFGTTCIYVTHDQAEAMSVGDRLAVLQDGRLLQCGTPRQVYSNPATLAVATSVGTPPINCLKGTVQREGEGLWFSESSQGSTEPVRVPLPQSIAEGLERPMGPMQGLVMGLRPESIRIAPSDTGAKPEGLVSGGVRAIAGLQWLGPETHVRFDGASGPIVVRAPGTNGLTVGQPVELWLDLENAFLFDAATGHRIFHHA